MEMETQQSRIYKLFIVSIISSCFLALCMRAKEYLFNSFIRGICVFSFFAIDF